MRVIDFKLSNASRKSDILNDSTLGHAVQNPCGRDINNFIRSSYDKESTNPPKDTWLYF